jgi:hypothetical protein
VAIRDKYVSGIALSTGLDKSSYSHNWHEKRANNPITRIINRFIKKV